MRRKRLFLAVALGALAATAGCFTPLQPGCAFSCAADHVCPSGYACADDGFCHRTDDAGVCLLTPPDASADATSDQGD